MRRTQCTLIKLKSKFNDAKCQLFFNLHSYFLTSIYIIKLNCVFIVKFLSFLVIPWYNYYVTKWRFRKELYMEWMIAIISTLIIAVFWGLAFYFYECLYKEKNSRKAKFLQIIADTFLILGYLSFAIFVVALIIIFLKKYL